MQTLFVMMWLGDPNRSRDVEDPPQAKSRVGVLVRQGDSLSSQAQNDCMIPISRNFFTASTCLIMSQFSYSMLVIATKEVVVSHQQDICVERTGHRQ